MTKFKAREPEVVDAYQFKGGEKDGADLARMINQMCDHTFAEVDYDIDRNVHRISVATGAFGSYIYPSDWVLIRDERQDLTHMTDADFAAKFEKVKFPRRVLIWKNIPDYPNYQISDNGKVRDALFHGYKKRTKDGDFILYTKKGQVRWSEAELGTEEDIKAFFAS